MIYVCPKCGAEVSRPPCVCFNCGNWVSDHWRVEAAMAKQREDSLCGTGRKEDD